jgi:hypothetical protein
MKYLGLPKNTEFLAESTTSTTLATGGKIFPANTNDSSPQLFSSLDSVTPPANCRENLLPGSLHQLRLRWKPHFVSEKNLTADS